MDDRPDLHAATELVTEVVTSIDESRLTATTPCPEYAVGDLLDHLAGLATAFTLAARKEGLDAHSGPPPLGSADRLVAGWKQVIPQRLAELAVAWDAPGARDGMTKAGGIDMPGEVGELVALNEVVTHGWDLAAATGQPYAPDAATLAALAGFTSQFPREGSPGAFGPWRATADDPTALERVLAQNGRDITWSPAAPAG
ncbi:TIGR03086 family metal-binding protein [Luteipulveratus flavus]|uniref:TIGR03086 family metal-binding protein n=1 Tax=Luteipulveratus flavus TaxID=3031728 RepID=A0ABT6C2N7_9MICO|nr:TIGR03086 family metal-binding protein [Luteipulveratus sp. YIM 133296]MDF8263204.1 TIGR03086 family metal-binding protein [Luteipulveratus sp. YIM 133296]